MAQITVTELTDTTVGGAGVFDQLMTTVEAHLTEEYAKNRIKGPEYSTVYLGALQSSMDQAIRFLLERDNAELIQKQIELVEQQILKAAKDILLVDAQIAKTNNDAAVSAQQVLNLQCEQLKCQAEIALINQNTANAVIQETVLIAQECKLRAEFDLITQQTLKSTSETALLTQKKVTETAQTNGAGVTTNSVVGKQNMLYDAQIAGFARDAEQKAAKIMVEAWSIDKSVEPELTTRNTQNDLDDPDVGAVIAKLKTGVGA